MTDDRKNFLLKLNDRYVYLEIKLLPLTQEMLASEQPQMTFQVLGIKEVTSGDDGEKPVEFPDDLEQIIIDKISKRQNQIKDILAQGKTFEYL